MVFIEDLMLLNKFTQAAINAVEFICLYLLNSRPKVCARDLNSLRILLFEGPLHSLISLKACKVICVRDQEK